MPSIGDTSHCAHPSPERVNDQIVFPADLVPLLCLRLEHVHVFLPDLGVTPVNVRDGEELLLSRFGTLVAFSKEPLGTLHRPMRRDLTEPGDTRVAEGGARVEAAGDGTGDERSALLGQQPEHPLLRRHQRIQPRRLAVEVVGNGALFGERRDRHIFDVGRFTIEARNCCFVRPFIKLQSLKEPVDPA